MKAIKGILLTCDSAVKQILLTMNEKESFIIEDLDDFHVVIKADEEHRVRRELDAEFGIIITESHLHFSGSMDGISLAIASFSEYPEVAQADLKSFIHSRARGTHRSRRVVDQISSAYDWNTPSHLAFKKA
ncbi:hypothetical protein BD410DRAFT_899442 [Rickenella mellea]|uniref:General transcription and DNA repair factor IIH subunit TFB5 n=1 Tax=Rickenella mellea TaxID=50990 RepID=A0A4Y7Q148_9AGAM|nr:hypothetical protein BD410DRAFT_899442 [Rickenella mellea]